MRPELILTAMTVLWGSTFIVTKDIVHQAPPFAYLALRFGLATLVLGALWGRRLYPRRLVLDGAILGLLNAAGLVLQVTGQVYTTASKSAFITSLNTPLVPLVSLALYGLRPTRSQLIAVGLATVGLWLLTYPVGGARWNAGDLYTVACALIYAFTIVEIARRSARHDARALTFVQVATAALAFSILLGVMRLGSHLCPPEALPELMRLQLRPLHLTPRLQLELAYLALFCTVITFSGQTWALARMSATHAAIIFALEPVFATAMALAWAGADEWPGSRGAAGAALVLLAVATAELGRRASSSSSSIER